MSFSFQPISYKPFFTAKSISARDTMKGSEGDANAEITTFARSIKSSTSCPFFSNAQSKQQQLSKPQPEDILPLQQPIFQFSKAPDKTTRLNLASPRVETPLLQNQTFSNTTNQASSNPTSLQLLDTSSRNYEREKDNKTLASYKIAKKLSVHKPESDIRSDYLPSKQNMASTDHDSREATKETLNNASFRKLPKNPQSHISSKPFGIFHRREHKYVQDNNGKPDTDQQHVVSEHLISDSSLKEDTTHEPEAEFRRPGTPMIFPKPTSDESMLPLTEGDVQTSEMIRASCRPDVSQLDNNSMVSNILPQSPASQNLESLPSTPSATPNHRFESKRPSAPSLLPDQAEFHSNDDPFNFADIVQKVTLKHQAQLQVKDEQMIALENSLERAKKTITQQNAAVDAWKQHISITDTIIKRQTIKWDKGQERIESLKATFKLYQSILRNLDMVIVDLQVEKTSFRSQLNLIKQNFKAAESSHEEYAFRSKAIISKYEEEISTLSHSLENLRNVTQESDIQIKSYRQSLIETEEERDKIKAELVDLNKVYEELSKAHIVSESTFKNESEALAKRLELIESTCQQDKAIIGQQDKDIMSLKSNSAALEERLAFTLEDNSRGQERLIEAEEKLLYTTALVESKSKALEELTKECQCLRTRISVVEAEKMEAQLQHDNQVRLQASQSQEHIHTLNDRISNLLNTTIGEKAKLEQKLCLEKQEIIAQQETITSLRAQLAEVNQTTSRDESISTADDPGFDLFSHFVETTSEVKTMKSQLQQINLASEQKQRDHQENMVLLQSKLDAAAHDASEGLQSSNDRIAELQHLLDIAQIRTAEAESVAHTIEEDKHRFTVEIKQLKSEAESHLRDLDQERDAAKKSMDYIKEKYDNDILERTAKFKEIQERQKAVHENERLCLSSMIDALKKTCSQHSKEITMLRSLLDRERGSETQLIPTLPNENVKTTNLPSADNNESKSPESTGVILERDQKTPEYIPLSKIFGSGSSTLTTVESPTGSSFSGVGLIMAQVQDTTEKACFFEQASKQPILPDRKTRKRKIADVPQSKILTRRRSSLIERGNAVSIASPKKRTNQDIFLLAENPTDEIMPDNPSTSRKSKLGYEKRDSLQRTYSRKKTEKK